MAHIKKQTTNYGTRYAVRWRDHSGKYKQKSFRTFKDAKAFKPLHEAAVLKGEVRDYNAAQTPLRTVAESWLDSLEVKPRTYEGYRKLLDTHILPAFGDWPVGSIQAANCRAYVKQLKDKGLAPATVRHAFVPLRRILDLAVTDKIISYNPAVGVPLPTNKSTRRQPFKPQFLTAEEVEALAVECDWWEPVDGLLGRFAAYTGLRAGEIAGLNISDLDLLRCEVRVERQRRKVKGGWVEEPPKSDRSNRHAPMPKWLADDLAAYLAVHPMPLGPASPLFPGRRNGGYTHGTRSDGSETPGTLAWDQPWERGTFIANSFKPALRRAGLSDKIRFHDLRHTYASLMAEAGKPIAKVSRWMGHSSMHITDVTYTHLFRTADGNELADIARPTAATQRKVVRLQSARIGVNI